MRSRLLLLVFCLAALPLLAQEPDAEGCGDPPGLNRLPQFRIGRCENKEFDAVDFYMGPDKKISAEGRTYYVSYNLKEGAPAASRVQIVRNYKNALAKLGGTVTYSEDDALFYMKATKNGANYWVILNAYNSENPGVHVIEEEKMRQDVVATAEALGGDLRSSGHVAVYGILFDTNSAEIKAESKGTLDEIGKLLKSDPSLKLYVVGHTDGSGVLDANMKLSQARADSVVKSLSATHGIAAARLKGLGVGPAAPVATNETEEGRAQNRRVELVKQ